MGTDFLIKKTTTNIVSYHLVKKNKSLYVKNIKGYLVISSRSQFSPLCFLYTGEFFMDSVLE